MATYKVNADEVWKIPQGSAYAIKHKALERVAAEQNITFDRPDIIETDLPSKHIALVVSGHRMNDAGNIARTEWATGEAAPYNNKNGYPVAMAEKRAKDRVTLKLLQAHGAIYSEDEADDFKQLAGLGIGQYSGTRENPHVTRPSDLGIGQYSGTRENPHVTRPSDLGIGQYSGTRENPHVTRPSDLSDAKIEVDPATGEIIDNIPLGDPSVETLSKKNARADYEAALKEMESAATPKQLETWGQRNKDRVQSYPSDWAEILRMRFAEHRDYLRGK
jgi:hypothetical protein